MKKLQGDDVVRRIEQGERDFEETIIEGGLHFGKLTIGTFLKLRKSILKGGLFMPRAVIDGYLDIREIIIEGDIDLTDAKIHRIYADGPVALASHLSIQSNIITSPLKLFSTK